MVWLWQHRCPVCAFGLVNPGRCLCIMVPLSGRVARMDSTTVQLEDCVSGGESVQTGPKSSDSVFLIGC